MGNIFREQRRSSIVMAVLTLVLGLLLVLAPNRSIRLLCTVLGAAMLVAGLSAEGVTRVGDLCHIDRGYEDIARDLRALGADVIRQETDNN